MEGDRGVAGKHQFVGLETPEGRVAVGELPLLADDLHRQHRVRRRGPDRVRALSATGAAGLRPARRSRRRPARARSPWWSRSSRSGPRGCLGRLRAAHRFGPPRDARQTMMAYSHEDPHAEQHRQGDHEQDVEVELAPRWPWSVMVPGGTWGPTRKQNSRSTTTLITTQMTTSRRSGGARVPGGPASAGDAGSPAPSPTRSAGWPRRSRHHLHESAHVPHGLHRPAVAVEAAEPTGHEALPRVLAGARRHERERTTLCGTWKVHGARRTEVGIGVVAVEGHVDARGWGWRRCGPHRCRRWS